MAVVSISTIGFTFVLVFGTDNQRKYAVLVSEDDQGLLLLREQNLQATALRHEPKFSVVVGPTDQAYVYI